MLLISETVIQKHPELLLRGRPDVGHPFEHHPSRFVPQHVEMHLTQSTTQVVSEICEHECPLVGLVEASPVISEVIIHCWWL